MEWSTYLFLVSGESASFVYIRSLRPHFSLSRFALQFVGISMIYFYTRRHIGHSKLYDSIALSTIIQHVVQGIYIGKN
jgi:hypothetical protein